MPCMHVDMNRARQPGADIYSCHAGAHASAVVKRLCRLRQRVSNGQKVAAYLISSGCCLFSYS